MSNRYFYITTTLPYINAAPHIGFGLEIVAADVIARFHRLNGEQVVFNTGTDEHGQKIYQKAQELGIATQTYCDQAAQDFKQLIPLLDLSVTNFIRTTDQHHCQAAQKFWQLAKDRGDIYLANYQTKYCVGCELEKSDSELENGHCPLHPHQELETRTEENYFFRFSRYQSALLELYQNQPDFVKPAGKLAEIQALVKSGLKDFSISRVKEKMPWGIPVPGDDHQVMYVWFDALINYLSTLGWPEDTANFKNFWPGVQIAGKDNLRQQSAMWQAMLLSAGIPPSQKILINGFINVAGQKMSKSLGNVITPAQLVARYGQAGTRYLLASLVNFGEDNDISLEKFDQKYQADLAHGLGNLCSRIAKLATQIEYQPVTLPTEFDSNYQQLMTNYQLSQTLSWLTDQISQIDLFLSQTKPWLATGTTKTELINQAKQKLVTALWHWQPFLPQLATQVLHQFSQPITKFEPLFPPLA